MSNQAILNLDWKALGKALRQSADDAHEGDTPSVDLAYSFLLDNPECFKQTDENGDCEDWPEGMPQEPPVELVAAYYGDFAFRVDIARWGVK
jgi:hypothetical protein